jgi:hypothetical protein
MRIDNDLTYSSAQTLTASGPSTNFINHRVPGVVAQGKQMLARVVLKAAPDAGNGDETYKVKIQTDDNTSFSSPTDLTPDFDIPRTAKKGDKFDVALPKNAKVEKYTRLFYTLGGTTPSLQVDAWLTDSDSVESWQAYEDRLSFA